MMRWYVALSAVFRPVFDESVVDGVAELLERQGVLFGGDSVQGNPGPALDVAMVVKAGDADKASRKASALLIDALAHAGARPGSFRLDPPHVMPMAEVEKGIADARKQRHGRDDRTNGNWLEVVVRQHDGQHTDNDT